MRAKVASYKKGQYRDRLVEKVQQLMAIEGEPGLAAKVALLSGLRRKEMVYAFCQEQCDDSACYGCKKLHVTNKRNGLSIICIDWMHDRKKCYFALLPTLLWQQFRSLPALNESDIEKADKAIRKTAGFRFSDMHALFGQVMSSAMSSRHIDILAGVAVPSVAKHCLMLEINEMALAYVLAWERAGVVLPVL